MLHKIPIIQILEEEKKLLLKKKEKDLVSQTLLPNKL